MKLSIPKWSLLLGPALLVLFGMALNALVMAANQGQMPVLWPGGCEGFPDGTDLIHTCMTADTKLKFLADWIVMHDGVASPGDMGIWGGIQAFWPCLYAWFALVLWKPSADKSR